MAEEERNHGQGTSWHGAHFRLVACTLLVLVVAIVVVFFVLQGPIHRGNFARLHDGMPLREVEAILGPPSETEPIIRSDLDTDVMLPTGMSIYRWSGTGREIILVVKEDGTTSGAVMGWNSSLLGRLRRWLGL